MPRKAKETENKTAEVSAEIIRLEPIYRYDIEQRTDAWYSLRAGRFTASEGQAIGNNGDGLESLCYDLAAEKLSKKVFSPEITDDMQRGIDLEAEAISAYELERGVSVRQCGFIEYGKSAGCSPDGIVGDDGGLEIKCPKASVFVRAIADGKMDSKHLWQCQMSLAITGRKWWDLALYNEHFPRPLLITRILPDEEKHRQIFEGIARGEKIVAEILEKVKKQGDR